jgi:hypothetical protein
LAGSGGESTRRTGVALDVLGPNAAGCGAGAPTAGTSGCGSRERHQERGQLKAAPHAETWRAWGPNAVGRRRGAAPIRPRFIARMLRVSSAYPLFSGEQLQSLEGWRCCGAAAARNGVMAPAGFPGRLFCRPGPVRQHRRGVRQSVWIGVLSELLSHRLLCSLRTSGVVLIQGRRVARTSVGVAMSGAKAVFQRHLARSLNSLIRSIDVLLLPDVVTVLVPETI